MLLAKTDWRGVVVRILMCSECVWLVSLGRGRALPALPRELCLCSPVSSAPVGGHHLHHPRALHLQGRENQCASLGTALKYQHVRITAANGFKW